MDSKYYHNNSRAYNAALNRQDTVGQDAAMRDRAAKETAERNARIARATEIVGGIAYDIETMDDKQVVRNIGQIIPGYMDMPASLAMAIGQIISARAGTSVTLLSY